MPEKLDITALQDRPITYLSVSGESALLGQYLKMFWQYKAHMDNFGDMEAQTEAAYHDWFTEAENIMPFWAWVIVNEIMHNLDTVLEGDGL